MTNTIKFDLPNADISAAIFIPASYAATVTGDELTAIRVAMNTKLKVQELTAWVREDLAGENLASKTIEGAKVAKGWNDLRLTTPYAITGKGFYIGYTFRQTSATKAILNLSRPGTGSLYLKGGKDEWADRSEEGILLRGGTRGRKRTACRQRRPRHHLHAEIFHPHQSGTDRCCGSAQPRHGDHHRSRP